MKQIIKGLFLVGVGLLCLGMIPELTYASEMNFSVKAILPENQRDKSQGYFDLRMTPGQTQVIQVELQNETDQDVVVETLANAATTNDNGLADYTHSTNKKDASLAISFADIAQVPKETVVPKQSTKILEISLHMPEKEFDGYLLGGLYFKEKDSEESTEKSKEDVAIENKFAYTLGVLLSETDTEVAPELDLIDAVPSQKVGRNVILLNIQNKHAALVEDMEVEAKVYDEHKKSVLFSSQKSGLKMAPNSNFNYSIPMGDEAFKPGTYQVEVVANDGYKSWKMSKTFEIKPETAKKYNKESIDVQAKSKDQSDEHLWMFIVGGVVVLLGVGGFAFWIGRRSSKI